MDLLQFKHKYIEEASDLLNKLDNDLIKFEKNPNDKEGVEQIFRVMHTLKGTSGMYGFDYIRDFTHELENIFNLVRDSALEVTTELFNITLASVDHIRNLLNDEQLSNPQNEQLHKTLRAQVAIILENAGLVTIEKKQIIKDYSDAKIRTWQILFMPDEEIITRGINTLYTLSDLLELGDYQIQEPDLNEKITFWSIFLVTDKGLDDIEDALIFVMEYCKIQLVAEFNIFKEEELNQRQKEIDQTQQQEIKRIEHKKEVSSNEIKPIKIEKHTSSRITVDAEKLDHLMFLVSELVTTKSELLLSIETKNEDRIIECVQKVDKLSKLFRDNALDIRLISMNELIMRFNRLVRDLTHSLNKNVEFETSGADVELDKNIIDSIAEPIMHLIRNCIDHGIETPEERAKANKPEAGIIKLFAYKSGSFVFVQISDDGRGIDKQKIIAKAIAKGLITETTQLTDKEIYDLIFLPGFSTAESLTQVSGRGVGMDIVRKKIQEVRGEIHIDSEAGLGTSFTLKLQQTISIIDTLLFRTHNAKFAIPVEEVENCQIINTQILQQKHSKQIAYNEELIPYISLGDVFEYDYQLASKQRVIVINKHDKKFALIVDEIIGEYQAVVKPLGSTFSEIEFISGASLLGDGSIALLLDSEKLKLQLVKHEIKTAC